MRSGAPTARDLPTGETNGRQEGGRVKRCWQASRDAGYLAVDYYFDHLKKTVASAPSGGTALGEKVKACAEQNISATQEFVRELSYAKDIQDMLRIQMEFMRSQMETFGEQAKELGVAFFEAASAPAKPPQSR
jgi:hypothetical protein